jgi:hypothetical protein
MQLTNEEITKVFYLYYGQKVLKFSPTAPATQQLNNGMMSYWKPECRLYLTSLKDISDEHIRDIRNLWERDNPELLPNSEQKEKFINRIVHLLNNGNEAYKVYHYLISKGYAVPIFFSAGHPLNYKNPFELGIAIEKKD